MDIPVFSGTHADLLIIAFHKLITSTNQRLQPLYDCLLTIIVNVSPYIKSLCMVSSTKLIHLLEAFSNVSFLFANSNNYYLVFFLLEILNNMIQYQFDGNFNLVYTIIRKRHIFFNLLNLPTDQEQIDQVYGKQTNKVKEKEPNLMSMEGAIPAKEAEPGTLKTTLAETPSVLNMTEKTQPIPVDPKNSTTKDEDNLNYNFLIENGPVVSTSALSELDLNKSSGSEMSYRLEQGQSPAKCDQQWRPNNEWVSNWKTKLPLQTILRLLQVLVPQVEKICIDKGLTDESEILRFLQNGTLVGLLPVPHPILIRKYQPNLGTLMWFRTYMWGVIYLRNLDPPIWYDTDVKLFEIQRV
ncbi:HID1 isoform X2 [Brachionus plicatilis]|uniref:HID1 isoform X2 n=1 Tax=Brachionus plicatilis TaxID=10195 RepID=A0A3M7P6D0_BRAPC|nr:HID1 isoform X2 [Brachionus plicatilis]